MAAQTSRDRKKAKMEELIAQVNALQTECERLRLLNEKLTNENSTLHKKLLQHDSNSATVVSSEPLNGSAASITPPLPQERESELAAVADGKVTKNKLGLLNQKRNLFSILAVLICLISCKSSNPKNVLKTLPGISYQETSSMILQRYLKYYFKSFCLT